VQARRPMVRMGFMTISFGVWLAIDRVGWRS